jgi:hypothetical protein
MSQRCHTAANRIFGADWQRRHFEAESHGGRQVDHQLEFGRMLHGDGFARFSIREAAIGRVGLLRRLIADFVQNFCDWRGCCRGVRTVPFVERIEEIVGRIIRQPDLALIVLPDQRLGRQIDRHQWGFDHGRRSNLRIAEQDDRARPHVEAEFLGGGSMIDFGEDREAGRLPLSNRSFKSRDSFFHRILAGLGYQAVVGCVCGSGSHADRERKRQARRDAFFVAHEDA